MKFTGKQLFDLGCPQNKIKFLVGREFESEEDAKKEFVSERAARQDNPNSVFNWIWSTFNNGAWLPMVLNGDMPAKMSRSELRRLLDSGGVQINGLRPKAEEDMKLPINELIFFPNSKRKTTIVA